jgi:predicted ATP-grasp superfamily ATP-dependent carboligase
MRTSPRKETRPPVVLLGGLHIVRALGMARIAALIASSERRTPAMASRHCGGGIELPAFGERDAVVETLVRAGRELAGRYGAPSPLFYDNEDRLSLVQDYRAALEPHFALLLNEPSLGRALLDKSAFHELAERYGLPVPRRLAWETLDAESGPVLVKPNLKTTADQSSLHRQLFGTGKARVFANGREARAERVVARLAGELAFQEYVPGGDDAIWSFHGFAAPGGDVLASYIGRKIRTFPELTGDSSYLRLAHDDGLDALGRDIAARLGLAGIFKMDFKRSASSGRFHLLEINTRFNLWNYLGARNGVNLPRVAYDFLTSGERPERARAGTRYRWVAMRYDWPAFRQLRARGGLGLAGWLLSLAYVPKVYELFAWSDPLPFARYWTRRLRAAFTRRMQRWLVTAS